MAIQKRNSRGSIQKWSSNRGDFCLNKLSLSKFVMNGVPLLLPKMCIKYVCGCTYLTRVLLFQREEEREKCPVRLIRGRRVSVDTTFLYLLVLHRSTHRHLICAHD